MNPTSKHLLIQTTLLCLLLLLLSFTKLGLKSEAQISCVQPPLMHGVSYSGIAGQRVLM